MCYFNRKNILNTLYWIIPKPLLFHELLALCEGTLSVTNGFPSQRGNYAKLLCFYVLDWTSLWANNRFAVDLRCNDHYNNAMGSAMASHLRLHCLLNCWLQREFTADRWKRPVTQKMFPFHDVIVSLVTSLWCLSPMIPGCYHGAFDLAFILDESGGVRGPGYHSSQENTPSDNWWQIKQFARKVMHKDKQLRPL